MHIDRIAGLIIAAVLAGLLMFDSPLVARTPADNENAEADDGRDGGNNADADQKAISFNFKGASYDEVLDFFSRATGLPVVKEADVPQGTVDFLSPREYDMQEALRVLNIILQARGVMLRVSDDMLYLRELKDMSRTDVPTYFGELPGEVSGESITTVVRPLEIALAKPMADRLSALVAEYGAITAMEEQNALLITETADNVRRLLQIIEKLDEQDPEGDVQIFRLEHTSTDEIMGPLESLMTERVERYVLDKDGEQRKIEENRMEGLRITPDSRTNSIVARGAASRIRQLRETLDILDVPAPDETRSIRTFDLVRLSPQEARQRLTELFSDLDGDRRPTIMPIEDLSKVTVIGSDPVIAEAAELLREIDGADEHTSIDDAQRTTRMIVLNHAEPQAAMEAMNGLLSPRQRSAVRMIPGTDGRSIVISGPAGEVEAVDSLVEVVDTPRDVDREVRLLRLTSHEPQKTIDRAVELYQRQSKGDPAEQIDVEFDAESRTLTMIGAQRALQQFTSMLREVESNQVVDRETRQIELAHATASEIVEPLASLARQLLEPDDGSNFTEPKVNPVDQLDLLIIRATPEQFGTLESLVQTLDRPTPDDFQFRVVSLTGADVKQLLDRADTIYDRLMRGRDDPPDAPEVEHDVVTGNIMLTGRTEAVRTYERALDEARQLLPPGREGRMVSLETARAGEVIEPLRELLETTAPVDPSRQVPEPTIEVVERTNSLYVVAEPAQHEMIERYVRDLDTAVQTDLPPLRLIQLRAADAQEIARLLRERYNGRSQEQRRERPVDVSADAATNTLVVTAHAEIYEEIREFVDEVNEAGKAEAERETMIFPLKIAQATDVASALEKLYPEPPMPVDRRGRPLPHLQEPREVHVSADDGTNTLIVEAPRERRESFEALVDQLDRVELPQQAELRTYRIKQGDPNEIARTLRELADKGVMSERGEDGQRIDVTIEVEPTSRTLIVAGDETTFRKTEQMLDELQAVPVERTLRVFDIVGADPRDLADRAMRLYDEQTADVPEAGEVSVEVDEDSSVLLVVADDESMLRFVSILNELRETVGPPPDVRLIALEHAEADEVVKFLRDMSTNELAMVGQSGGRRPTFEAISRTNSVLVAARAEQHEVIGPLIDSLDQPEAKEMPPLRILQLQAADAQNLADALNRQYASRPAEERQARPVTVNADPNTNALMVAAHPDLFGEIQSIVDDLNQAERMDYEGREIKIFPLRVAQAEDLARTIDEMYPEPPVPVDRRGRPLPHLQQEREVVVRADRQTNSLIVDAPVQRMAGFEELVEQLDRQNLGDEKLIRTYRVTHADLDQVAQTLRDLADDGSLNPAGRDRHVSVTINTEPVSQTLIVSGPEGVFDRVDEVLSDLDVRHRGPGTTMRIFQLEHARAESLADMLRSVLTRRIVEEVTGRVEDAEALLNVSHDAKTNALIISAPENIMPVAEQLIDQLDDKTAKLHEPVIRVRPLTFADAREVADAMRDAMQDVVSDVTGEPIDVRLTAAGGSNALILTGIEEDLARVEEMIDPLDARPAMDSTDARTFSLTHADAATIAPIVERLLADQQQTDPRLMFQRLRRGAEIDTTPPIRVEADDRTNNLIVSGTQQTVSLAETLIDQLDIPDESAEKTYRTFTPSRARPTQLVETVQRVVRATRPSGRRSTLELIAEPQSGAIVIIGTEDEAAEAEAMLAERDRDTPAAPQLDFQVIDVEHSAADVIAETLTPLLRDENRWPQALREALRAGRDVTQPTITADADANRLLVSAPQELMPIARQLVSDLDRPRAEDGATDVRIFHLRQANAAEVAEAVRKSLEARRGDRPGRPTPVITAEPSSNSLLATALPEQLTRIEAMVRSLDETTNVDQAQVRTVFLEHARADAVAPLVRDLLAGEELPSWIRYDAITRGRDLPETGPEVRVAADSRLNAVMVSAVPVVLDVAEQMIEQLDVDPEEAGGAPRRSVRVLRVRNADARELVENLSELFDDPDQHETPPSIRVDESSNALLVRATDKQFETIEQVVREIDQATIATARQMEMIRIDPSRGDAAEIAETLKRLLGRGNSESTVEVISIEQLIERHDQDADAAVPTDPRSMRDSAPMRDSRHAAQRRPRDSSWLGALGLSLTAMIGVDAAVGLQDVEQSDTTDQKDGDRGGGRSADRDAKQIDPDGDAGITIAVDPASNSLVVLGAPHSIERVAELARQIEEQFPASPGRIRYVPLPDAVDARNVSRLVVQTMRSMTPAGGQRGDLARRVGVLADPAGNALVITANDHDFETVGELVAALARPGPSEEMIVKVYSLERVSANRAAESVRNLFAADGDARPRGRQAERVRQLALTLQIDDEDIDGVFDPARVRVTADGTTNSLMVMGPPVSLEFVDRYIELIDQHRVDRMATLNMRAIEHARAQQLQNTLQRVFWQQFNTIRNRLGPDASPPQITADDRTNTLIVSAPPEMMGEINSMIDQLDQKIAEDAHELEIIELSSMQPTQAARVLEQVVIADDQQRRATTSITPADDAGVLMVRADEATRAEIDRVLGEIDRDATRDLPVRSITLERADAGSVARAIQQFYDDRARIASAGRGRRPQQRQVSIVGDSASSTLLVAASDDDFEEVSELVEQFDTTPAARSVDFRAFTLQHADAEEILDTVQGLVEDLAAAQGPMIFQPGRRGRQVGGQSQSLSVRADSRLNVLIVTGREETFEAVEPIVDMLDAPEPDESQRIVRLYPVRGADLNLITQVIEDVFSDGEQRQWWEPPDPEAVQVHVDERSRMLLISARPDEHDEIADLIDGIGQQIDVEDHDMRVVSLEYADANELAGTLQRFLADRAESTGEVQPRATILPSRSANSLIVSALPEHMRTVRDLVERLDDPDAARNRVIEIIALQDGEVEEIARIVREQFRDDRQGRGVRLSPDLRTNSLIVNAPEQQFARVEALIRRLDTPPASDETIIRTYTLDGARADEARRILSETLQLDSEGRTDGISIRLEDDDAPAVEVQATIVADRRSNSLIVTATPQSFPVIESIIQDIDDVPTSSPVEYRLLALEHALADEVALTLRQVARGMGQARDDPEPRIDYNRSENQLVIAATSDQFEQIERIVEDIDQPSTRQRVTDFVPLEFAEAEKVQEALSVFYGQYAMEADTPSKRNVRIVADTATNSLVVSADEREWEGIRNLLSELDSEEYDSSLQLQVFPLQHADAPSVAQAINEAFQGEIERSQRSRERQQRPQQRGRDEDRRDEPVPTVLVESQEWVRASAEPQTNSVVVSASRQNLRKIETIVTQLDIADFAKMPAPRIIPVTAGSAEDLAESLNRLYERTAQGGRGRQSTRQSLRIVGDSNSSTLIVRAADEEFAQIKALADAIQQEATDSGLGVHVLSLNSASATRIASSIREAYAAKAERTNEPLSVQVDRSGNNLVIASSRSLFEEIEATVRQLDDAAPVEGQGIFIIELENISPDAAQSIIETIGLNRDQPDDAAVRLVSEPMTILPLRGRNAVMVVANPADRDNIVGLLKAVDAEPELAESQMRIVRLENAEAEAIVEILEQVLSPGEQQADTPLARAVQEQIRRLAVRKDRFNDPEVRLDLTKPIKLIADDSLNAVVVSSTADNVLAMEEVITMFDKLPITDAVTVQMFNLQNMAANDFMQVVRDLFDQGKELGVVRGTDREAVPEGMVGKALLDELAVTVDERTNTVVVAGKEDAVALVEVMVKRLDNDVAPGWVESRIVRLTHADAENLAELIEQVIVRGSTDLPQATPMQRQIGRLRAMRQDEQGNQHAVEGDVFHPMSRLVVEPESQLNALVLVGTPRNLKLVEELVSMLDIEAASPSADVQLYPVKHASASRLAVTIRQLFDQQADVKAIRGEDRVIVEADERTNTLIITTSPRSFAVVEHLLDRLDSEIAPDLREIRRVEVDHASATRLAPLVQEMMDARLERMRQVQPETADLEQATIIAEPRTNSLIVAAGDESFEVVERLVAELDSASLPESAEVHVIRLDKANGERIADTVAEIMDRRYADMPDDVQRSQRPLVLTDPRSNSLLVTANREDLRVVEDLVEKLEGVPSSPAVGLHVVPLEVAQAEQLAPRLEQLMSERQQSLGDARSPSDRVSIEPYAATNSLIVAASNENLDVIEGFIEALGQADSDTPGEAMTIISLANSRPSTVVSQLNDLYVDDVNRRRGPNTIRVTADERINAVLVHAPQRDLAAIRSLINRLDDARPSTVTGIKYVHLTSANALEIVNLIENVLSGRGIGQQRAGEQATIIQYLREINEDAAEAGQPGDEEDPEMAVSAAVREAISLTPDLRTNTVIVKAPSDSLRVIEQMIRDLDASSIGAQKIRTFHLENADAIAMASLLTDLFNLQQDGELFVLKPREAAPQGDESEPQPGRPQLPGQNLLETELTAVPDRRQQLSITVDNRTNSLLVSGTPTYLDLVADVVNDLDQREATERETLVYALRNAEANEVAQVITDFVEREQEKLISTLGTDQLGSAARLLEREVTVVGDEKSNTVLVSASPRYMQRVKDMIKQLDVDPPQVLIQVMLAEVTLDTTDEWGVDAEVRGNVDGADVAAGYGLAEAFVSGIGVPNLSVASSDFDLLIKALTAQGRLQVLSNPSIMAANNEQARIQIGETIRVPTGVSVTDSGQTRTEVTEEEVGVILNVQPSINPEGFVRMVINPEISDVTARTIQISEDFSAPIISRRTADTTVTVFDGQTVVLGGLISDRFERRDRMVPFLGELPLVGPLFRSEFEETTKTELLIVLTPHVIESPAELHHMQDISDRQINRLSLPDEMMDVMLEGVSEERDGGIYDAQGRRLDKKSDTDAGNSDDDDPLNP